MKCARAPENSHAITGRPCNGQFSSSQWGPFTEPRELWDRGGEGTAHLLGLGDGRLQKASPKVSVGHWGLTGKKEEHSRHWNCHMCKRFVQENWWWFILSSVANAWDSGCVLDMACLDASMVPNP